MKTRTPLLVTLACTLLLSAVLVLPAFAAPHDTPQAAVAKKKTKKKKKAKKTWCQRKSAAIFKKEVRGWPKGKSMRRVAYVKRAKFSIYKYKNGSYESLWICSEAPKFVAPYQAGGDRLKVENLKVVPKRCAFFTVRARSGRANGVMVDHKYFVSRYYKGTQPSMFVLGLDGHPTKIHKFLFTKNCKFAVTFNRGSEQRLAYGGVEDFKYKFKYEAPYNQYEIPNWTMAEMKSLTLKDGPDDAGILSWKHDDGTVGRIEFSYRQHSTADIWK